MAEVDTNKLRDKVHFICERVEQLRVYAATPRNVFLADETLQYASVRALQVAIEAMIDIANHVVARLRLGIPKTYAEAFDLLVRAGILPAEGRDTFRAMVRFRNRAVHLYDEVQADEVFSILQEHVGDFELFTAAIVRRFLTEH